MLALVDRSVGPASTLSRAAAFQKLFAQRRSPLRVESSMPRPVKPDVDRRPERIFGVAAIEGLIFEPQQTVELKGSQRRLSPKADGYSPTLEVGTQSEAGFIADRPTAYSRGREKAGVTSQLKAGVRSHSRPDIDPHGQRQRSTPAAGPNRLPYGSCSHYERG